MQGAKGFDIPKGSREHGVHSGSIPDASIKRGTGVGYGREYGSEGTGVWVRAWGKYKKKEATP